MKKNQAYIIKFRNNLVIFFFEQKKGSVDNQPSSSYAPLHENAVNHLLKGNITTISIDLNWYIWRHDTTAQREVITTNRSDSPGIQIPNFFK